MTLGRAAAAEAIGTGLLLAVVVGSGIMGEQLAQGNMAIALLSHILPSSFESQGWALLRVLFLW
jgi:hypothetical protein